MVVLAASAFGPYLTGGLRTDQVVTYCLAVLLGIVWLPAIRATIAQAVTVGLLSLFVVFAAIHMVFSPGLRGRESIAMLDNLTMPVAVCLVMLILVQVAGRERLLRILATTTIIGMLANSLLTISQVGTSGPLSLGRWRPAGETSTGDLAAELGRFTGILNQPAMASILYGLAMLLAIYRLQHKPVVLILVLSILSVGGILSISKTFLFVVLPVVAVVLALVLARRSALLLVLLAAALAWVIIMREEIFDYLQYETAWSGAGRLRLVITDLSNVGGVSGGRLGDSGSVTGAMNYVWETAPIIGLGPGGLSKTPVDTLWLLGASINGLIGYSIVTALLVALAVGVFRRRHHLSRVEYLIGMGLVVMLIGGAFGYPVFYGDRLAIPLWATLMLLLSAKTTDAPRPRPATVPSSQVTRPSRPTR